MQKLLCVLLFVPLFIIAQSTDSSCLKTRWIALRLTEANANIFGLDTSLSKEQDLVQLIKELVEKGKLRIYIQNENQQGFKGWFPIDYKKEIKILEKDSVNAYWPHDPYFEILEFPKLPLATVDGYDSLIYNPDGTIEFCYPPPTCRVFHSSDCDEIRIKEDRALNMETGEYEFIPVGLSFYFADDFILDGHEKFWVDLNELFSAIHDESSYYWFEDLIKKRYKGSQYMKVSCYNPEFRF